MFALIIKDEENNTIVNHVANFEDDAVHVPDAHALNMPTEWRKAGHLIEWVKTNEPYWKIFMRYFDIVLEDNTIVMPNTKTITVQNKSITQLKT